ncbi:MAG TPA: NADH-quinone oxidoreductase subunit A, partial [Leptospiraceae bacterium]|nr:NADH-quinone oxidoreductase subunit A [Leptospiraceae bacterium]
LNCSFSIYRTLDSKELAPMNPVLEQYWPFAVFFVVAMLVAVGGLVVQSFLGPKLSSKHKFDPYECGLDQMDSPHKPYSLKFYVVALLFMLFDIETIFLLPWAVGYRSFGWESLIAVIIFSGIVVFGLWYVVKLKVFEWD